MTALKYEPNGAARSLSRRKGSAVAVVAPFFTRASVVDRLRGVQTGLIENDRDLLLIGVDDVFHMPRQLAGLPQRVDACAILIISLRPADADFARMVRSGVPIVGLDVDLPGVPSIVSDNVGGGRHATEHLLALGHRRIAYVGDIPAPGLGFTSSRDRQKGYESALFAAGLGVDDDLVVECPFGEDTARIAATKLLQRDDVTAIVCHSDTEALGVLGAAQDLGKQVPHEVSVVGCDDVEVARHAGLTTMKQALVETGELAARLIRDALEGRAASSDHRCVFEHELVVRRSTSAPRSVT